MIAVVCVLVAWLIVACALATVPRRAKSARPRITGRHLTVLPGGPATRQHEEARR